MIITSAQNPRIKSALRLRERRGRQQQGRTIIDGLREIRQALRSGVKIVEVFTCVEDGPREGEVLGVVQQAKQAGSLVFEVSPRILEKVGFGKRIEGVVAIAETNLRNLAQFDVRSLQLVAVLDAIEKPGNLGAILRSGDAVGLDAAILTDGGTDIFNPNTIRASLGTVFSIPTFATTAIEAKTWLLEQGVQIVAADVRGEVDYDQIDLSGPTAIVLGSEARGLSPAWDNDTVTRMRLPMFGSADSLNVSVTASVLFYEALRQRRRKPRR